jgi:hypothetical protein
VRLIEILPQDPVVKPGESSELACKVITVSLDDKPRYIALSYAWEDNARVKPILLNGRLSHITASLDAALRQIRRIQTTKGSFPSHLFWVDAVCINQEDEIEKSWQEQQMNRIFKEAAYA